MNGLDLPGDITYTAPYPDAVPILAARHLDLMASVSSFAVSYDETADHTDWLQKAVDRIGSDNRGASIGIRFPHPVYTVSAKLSIPYDNVFLIFRGGGNRRNSVENTRASAASRLAFSATATPDVLLEWAPLDGSDFGVLGGGILGGVMLDAPNKATRGLSVLSAHDMTFEGVHAYGATEAMIYTGPISGTLGTGDYSSKGHIWRQCKAHAHNLPTNAAYALHENGGQGAGGTDSGNVCFNRFESCEFTSRNNHAVRLENSDSNIFSGGSMVSEVGGAKLVDGLVTGFGGLEICSSSQTVDGASARHSSFSHVQINDTIIRAGQSGGGSPNHIEFFGNNFANAGGTVLVETAAGDSPDPHAIVYDSQNGIRVWGNSVFPYQIRGVDRIHMIEGVDVPSPQPGYATFFIDKSDGEPKIRRGDGTIEIIACVRPRLRVKG